MACGGQPSDIDMFSKAQEYERAQEFNKAIETYQQLIDKYPESEIRYKAVFMIGFNYFENLKDSNKAIEYFDVILNEFPDCDLADDATALKNMALEGKDILSAFEDSISTK
jgi:TolA-binding protein